MAVSRRVAIVAVVVSVVGLLSAAPSQARAQAQARDAHPRLHWSTCGNADLRAASARCATLRVPLDYDHPDRPHDHPRSRAGPAHRARLAIPGRDADQPRRSGQRRPLPGRHRRRTCRTTSARSTTGSGSTPAAPARAVRLSRATSATSASTGPTTTPPDRRSDCLAGTLQAVRRAPAGNNGAILEHMTTADSARDLNAIRIALRVRQINFYGFSYGTYLGQVYATLFPKHVAPHGARQQCRPDAGLVRREPRPGPGVPAQHQGLVRLARPLQRRVSPGQHRGTPSSTAGTASGTSWPRHADHGIGPDEWTDVFLDAEYYQSTWLNEARLFAGFVHHHDYKADPRRLQRQRTTSANSPSTTRCSAPTSSGRPRGRRGRATTPG